MAEEGDRREVPLTWIGVEDVPILSINQILAQIISPQEIIVTLGQVAPPIVLGTDEQKREQMRR